MNSSWTLTSVSVMTRTRKFTALSASVLAAALTLSACGSGEAAPADSPEAAQTQESEAAPTTEAADDTSGSSDGGASASASQQRGGSLDDARAAVETAEAENGGTAHSLDFDNGRWEIDVIADGSEWEYDISQDGSTVERADEDRDEDDDDRRELEQAEVSLVEALEIALEDTPGTIDDIDLDEDDGTLRWDVSIHPEAGGGEQEIEVDAASGDIVSSRHDGDDDGDDDDD